jgi:putative transposase
MGLCPGGKLDFIRPGKPVESAVIESFNGGFRDERLNAQVFVSLQDARQKIEAWRGDYNEHRPHGSIGNLTLPEFAEQASQIKLQGHQFSSTAWSSFRGSHSTDELPSQRPSSRRKVTMVMLI